MSVSMFYRETFDHGYVQINWTVLNVATGEIIYFMVARLHDREYGESFSSANIPISPSPQRRNIAIHIKPTAEYFLSLPLSLSLFPPPSLPLVVIFFDYAAKTTPLSINEYEYELPVVE